MVYINGYPVPGACGLLFVGIIVFMALFGRIYLWTIVLDLLLDDECGDRPQRHQRYFEVKIKELILTARCKGKTLDDIPVEVSYLAKFIELKGSKKKAFNDMVRKELEQIAKELATLYSSQQLAELGPDSPTKYSRQLRRIADQNGYRLVSVKIATQLKS